jgi:hypothetical protein
MHRLWITCLALSLVCGCKSGEEPVRGSDRGVPAAVYTPRPGTPKAPVATPSLEFRNNPDLVLERASGQEPPERNLAEELKEAVGVPVDCVRDFQASRPTTIRVSVSAIVRPTGMVIQPSAYGSGLSNEARQCLEQRVGIVVLKPLDDTVSESVSTIIEIEYEPPVVIEADPGVPEPVLKNVRESLPKRPEVAPSGKPIQAPTSKSITGGFDGGRPIKGGTAKKVTGPKPRAIDGYEVDENAQEWTDR